MKISKKYQKSVTQKNYNTGKIHGVEVVKVRYFPDERGTFSELFRLSEKQDFFVFTQQDEKYVFKNFKLKQASSSLMRPGLIKAFHYHKEQTDIWTVSPGCGNLQVGLIDLRENSPTFETMQTIYIGDYSNTYVRIPPGVAHGGMNIGTKDAILTYFVDRHFDINKLDEWRLPPELNGFKWGIPNG